MDALSDVLQVLRLSGAVFLDAEFTAPWCVSSKSGQPGVGPLGGEHIVFFHWLIEGRCKAQLANGGDTFEISAGDLLLMPNDETHVMGSDLKAQPISAESLVKPHADGGMLRIVHGGGGETTRLVCGFLACDKRLSKPVLDALPGMLRVPFGDDPASAWLKSLLARRKRRRAVRAAIRCSQNYPSCCLSKRCGATAKRCLKNKKAGLQVCVTALSARH